MKKILEIMLKMVIVVVIVSSLSCAIAGVSYLFGFDEDFKRYLALGYLIVSTVSAILFWFNSIKLTYEN